MKIYKIIPFRLASKRFKNKPLVKFGDKSLLENIIEITNNIKYGETIITSTKEDYKVCKSKINLNNYNYQFIPSSIICNSATDRIIEIYNKLDGDLYISIPIDEVLLNHEEINKVLDNLNHIYFKVATLYCDFYNLEDAVSNLSAKIVTDNNNIILYMSRSMIPISKSGKINIKSLKKNIGVFFFKRIFLDELKSQKGIESYLDKYEGLEQLRWLELGHKIKTIKINHYGYGIDIPEQIKLLEERVKCLQKQKKYE